jgi:hypothetical protein
VLSQVDFVGGQFRVAEEHSNFLLLLTEDVALLLCNSGWVLVCAQCFMAVFGVFDANDGFLLRFCVADSYFGCY